MHRASDTPQEAIIERREVSVSRKRSGGSWGRVVLVGLLLAVSGCDDNGSNGGTAQSVVISGSSTVEPISALVGQAYAAEHPQVQVRVDGPGTGDGFRQLCAGTIDIADASRLIKDEEKAACAQGGVEWIELVIGVDGLSVITSPRNPLTCLSFTDLYALLGPESLGFKRWSDADSLAGELAAPGAPYPDERLSLTAPGEESGTYNSFVEIVLGTIAQERGQEVQTRPDYGASPNDNTIIQAIAGADYSLGWVGYAFYVNNQDKVKALAVRKTGGDCVAPSRATVVDGSYPISRPLFLYVNKAKAAANPTLVSFIDYYLSEAGLAAVEDAGYVPLADYGATRAAWAAR